MVIEPDAIVMNNDSSEDSGPSAIYQNGIQHEGTATGGECTVQTGQQAKADTENTKDKVSRHADNANEDGRSDSEAETVVMPGKEEGLDSGVPKRAIKHENGVRAKSGLKYTNGDSLQVSKDRNHSGQEKHKKPGALTETNNSSNLSSTRSSPGRGQEERPASRANSESAQSKSKLSVDSDTHSRASVPRKRKISGDEADERLHRRRVKRERRSEERSTTEPRKVSNPRSESPARQRPRALSTQSSNPSSTHKRRKPPPLAVGTKRRGSEDTRSNDSGSPQASAHPKRSTVFEDTSMPKPHRKLRDKNGRTLLARACAVEDVESVVARLKDRPEDIDDEDNAGNTPLQIAALEGNAEIVRVLLEHGCKADCMNLDRDTPLIDAVENGHLNVVKLLVKAGVNPRQVNAKGEEPIDLVDPEGDNAKDIKAVLEKARERFDRRRHSEDVRPPNTAKESLSGRSPRASPSLHGTRSPPPPTSRRRPARSEPSRNDLLWLNPTPEMLREKAGKGDGEAVLHILEMKPMGDPEALLAAAKGGHELCLSFLFAMGKANPDPDPLRKFKDGLNTPMLVAIGRNNIGVLKLLLDQPSFDPTRRIHKKLTYYELAKERRGVGWEEEYRLLKSAYDKHKDRTRGKSPNAVHKSPQSREAKKALRQKSSTSPLRASQKSSSPTLTAKDSWIRKRASAESKNGHVRRERDRDRDSLDKVQDSSKRHLKVPRHDSREGSTAVSDREASPLRLANGEKRRSLSDAEKDVLKPRKRLVSGKDMKNDQEKKQRRNSLISMGSTSSTQEQARSSSTKELASTKAKREENIESKSEFATAKKRARRSDTPPNGRVLSSSKQFEKQSESNKPKRPRVNSDSSVQDKSPRTSAQLGPARIANMATVPSSSGSAPVAFMGGSISSIKDIKISPTIRDSTSSPLPAAKGKSSGTDKSTPKPAKEAQTQDHEMEQPLELAPDVQQNGNKRGVGDEPGSIIAPVAAKDDFDNASVSAHITEDQLAAQSAIKKRLEHEVQVRRQEEEAAELSKRQEREMALLKQKKDAEDALRLKEQQEAEAEAVLLRKKREEEEAARLQREKEAEEEAARQRQKQAEAEEEARRRQKQAEAEEAARLKRKREEQEEAARLEKKREEDQERQRLRKQQEEERQRRDRLPNGLRWAAGLGAKPRDPEEVQWWLPLMFVKGSKLDPSCAEHLREEQWVTNIQVAPLLGLIDLTLSQCMLIYIMHIDHTDKFCRYCLAQA